MSVYMLKAYQMSSYNITRMTKAFYSQIIKYFICFLLLVETVNESKLFLVIFASYIVISVLRKLLFSNKKIAITRRMIRFIATNIVISILLIIGERHSLLIISFISSHIITYPVERIVYKYYKQRAKKVLKKYNGTIIAITGSYGKTTTKYYLKQILSQRHSVLMSDKSYNTPMGLCKTINNKLNNGYEFFIAEFGAAKKGDIEELMKMVKPNVGVLLNVGVQHLETFKTKENIKKEKIKILNLLDKNCTGIYSSEYVSENEIINDITKIDVDSIRGYSLLNVKYNFQNTTFDILYNNKILTTVTTKLFGLNNAKNLYMAITIAHVLGMDIDDINKSISNLENFDSRGIMTKIGNITVIDNSFNSNPEGAFNNINSIKDVDAKKIIITPGFVELGQLSRQSHKVFANLIVETFDNCILIDNKEITPMKEHFDYYNYEYELVDNFKQAFEIAKNLYRQEEVIILIENDIPDLYMR